MKKERVLKVIYNIQGRLENNILFSSIRQGMIYAMPAFIIGSVALLLLYLPFDSYTAFLNGLLDGKIATVLSNIHTATFGIISPILVLTIAYSYSKQKNSYNEGDLVYLLVSLISFLVISDFNPQNFNFNSFGVQGVFIAMVVSLFSSHCFCEIKNLLKKNSKLRVISGSDGLFNRIASNTLPLIIVVVLVGIIEFLLTIVGIGNLQASFSTLLCKMFGAERNFGTGLLYVFIVAFLWIFGIHGGNTLEAVALSSFTELNGSVFSKAFNDVFVIMGGSGSILCFVLAVLIFSRNKRVRRTNYFGLPLVLFNISEPIIFGIPIILNLIFVIPFLVTPIVCYCTSYLAMYLHWVPVVNHEVIWTTPVFISGYLSTGSIWGSVLQLINLTLGVLIYGGFVKLNDKMADAKYADGVKDLSKKLIQAEDNGQKLTLLTRNSNMYTQSICFDLLQAFKNKEFKLFYQPQINDSGKCYGAEGLLRYKHPVCGYVMPPLIIKLFQEFGEIFLLEQYILEEAISFIRDTDYQGLISVNVTADYFENPDCVSFIIDTINKYGISPKHIAIEITEETAITSHSHVFENITALREHGIITILDDFGMGHTSILYLQEYKFDEVKITGELVKSIMTNPKSQDIISSIVTLGMDLGFAITAEYVETKEMRDILAELGCKNFQGYYYSKALPAEEFIEYANKLNSEAENTDVENADK